MAGGSRDAGTSRGDGPGVIQAHPARGNRHPVRRIERVDVAQERRKGLSGVAGHRGGGRCSRPLESPQLFAVRFGTIIPLGS